jgi:SagB-type dehydrogenase family enzyme
MDDTVPGASGLTLANPKQALHRLIDLLSEDECAYLRRAAADISDGDRFWEEDVGLLYNEFVKVRYSTYARNPSAFWPVDVADGGGPLAPVPLERSLRNAPRTGLPPMRRLEAQLSDVLRSRRSRRQFAEGFTLDELSTFLQNAYGRTGTIRHSYGYKDIPLRSAPSSGGLQSTEVYLFAARVEGLAPALYRYSISHNCLELVRAGYDAKTLREWTPGLPAAATAPVVLVLSGVYDRLRWKYGARSYRYMCMDAGIVCQNMYLVSEAMNLSFCAGAGFIEDELEQYLGIDGKGEMLLLTACLGRRINGPATGDVARDGLGPTRPSAARNRRPSRAGPGGSQGA